jgi:3-oxoacyl-[acyl-carrier-protein] synthase-3
MKKIPRTRSRQPSRTVSIIGTGSYVPERILTNADLEKVVETSDEWITTRTGIKERRIAAHGEHTSHMAAKAAQNALDQAGVAAGEIDLIIVATVTPDTFFPSTACHVQRLLGADKAACFDVSAACSGFLYGIEVAQQFISNHTYNTVLVIGADKLSSIVNWNDRNTCVLFGDGAGALVVEAEMQNGSTKDRGVLATCLRSDGRYRDKLYVDGGPSTTGTVGYVRMDGPEVFRHAVTNIAEVIDATLKKSGYQAADIDWFVPHQANRRILDGAARKLGLAPEKIVITVDKHANTSAASIPLALNAACRDGRIKKGDLVLMEAMGGGFTWGAVLVRW